MGGVSFSDMLAALAFYAVLIVLVLAALVGLLAFIIWGATHPRLAGGDTVRYLRRPGGVARESFTMRG